VNVYAATKSFVLSFSRALGAELKPRGIHVLAVCPMWVQTEFFDHAVVDETAVVYYNKMWQPEQVVTQALKDLKKGRDVSVLGAYPKLQVLLTKLIPHKLVMRVWLKQQKHI
jgi:short-subunit dehydrogenase